VNRKLEIQLSPDAAFDLLKAAAEQVGKAREVSPLTRSLDVLVPSGPFRSLTPTRLHAAVLTGPEGTAVLEIAGNATVDAYGYERHALDKLVKAVKADSLV